MKKILVILCLALIGLVGCGEETAQEEAKPVVKQEVKQEQKDVPKYEIVYEDEKARYDGGVKYYILIDPVDLESDYKTKIKEIIKDMVKKKGGKISIEIHDNKESLDLDYNAAIENKVIGKEEGKIKENHLIAMFSGELDTGIYPNSLDFFPATTTDNPTVGEHIEFLEFNP